MRIRTVSRFVRALAPVMLIAGGSLGSTGCGSIDRSHRVARAGPDVVFDDDSDAHARAPFGWRRVRQRPTDDRTGPADPARRPPACCSLPSRGCALGRGSASSGLLPFGPSSATPMPSLEPVRHEEIPGTERKRGDEHRHQQHRGEVPAEPIVEAEPRVTLVLAANEEAAAVVHRDGHRREAHRERCKCRADEELRRHRRRLADREQRCPRADRRIRRVAGDVLCAVERPALRSAHDVGRRFRTAVQLRGTSLHGLSRSTRTSPGRPSTRSPRMLSITSVVPPSIEFARLRRNAFCSVSKPIAVSGRTIS